MSGTVLDFPPPPTSPTVGQTFTGPLGVTWLWDGTKWTAGGGPEGAGGGGIDDAPNDGNTYGRQNKNWTEVLPIVGGTMQGSILLQPGIPINPLQAVTKQYVDEIAALEGLYQGTWEVAADNPSIVLGAALDSTNYLAITVDPNVAEMAPTNVPGIGGLMINNGDRIFWASPLQKWQRIVGDGLDLQIGDARYLQLAGGNMSGNQYFETGAALAFYDSKNSSSMLEVNASDALTWTTTNAGGGTQSLLSIPMLTDNPMLTITPDTTFGGNTWLAHDPVALLQAATKNYVDTHIAASSGALQYAGTINGATGQCAFTAASGITPNPGPLPPAASHPNFFVVCDNPGVIPSGPAIGVALSAGDWLVSDGVFWNHIAIGSAGLLAQDIALSPSVVGATNVQQALQTVSTSYLPLTGGTLTGNLFVTTNHNVIVGAFVPSNIGPSQIITPYFSSPWHGFNVYVNNANPVASAYLNNGGAALIYTDSSWNLQFLTAPVGLSGGTIPWAQAMVINQSGNVTIGGGRNVGNPLALSVGSGGYANIIMTVGGVRSWWTGVGNDGQFHIADITANTDRVIVGLDGAVNLYSSGVRYQWYGGHSFAMLWDGSFIQMVVDGGSQGQYAPIGFNDSRYLFRGGDNTGGSFTFGYVGCYGNMYAVGTISASGNLQASGGLLGGYLNTPGSGSFGQNIVVGASCQIGSWGSVQSVGFYYAQNGSGHGFSFWLGDTGNVFIDVDNYYSVYLGNISDERFKEDIKPSSFDCLGAIMRTELYQFKFKKLNKTAGGSPATVSQAESDAPLVPVGFLAQTQQKVFPESVSGEELPDGTLSVNTNVMIAALVGSVQQLERRLAAAEARLR